jgi:hypothetical protein
MRNIKLTISYNEEECSQMLELFEYVHSMRGADYDDRILIQAINRTVTALEKARNKVE